MDERLEHFAKELDMQSFWMYKREVSNRDNPIQKMSARRGLLNTAKLIVGRRYFSSLDAARRDEITATILEQTAYVYEHDE